jgi:curved DNA-binding protein CbpA
MRYSALFFSLTFIGTAILFLNLFGRETRNHYELLGVYASASEVEIKNAFRRESLKYHPDKNPNDEYAKERFLKLVDAKETLTDKNKRAEYDAQLERERSRPHPQASYHQNRPPPSTSVFQYLIADSSADCSSVICWYLTIIMQTAATSLSFLGFFRFLFCLAITSVITQLLFPFFLNALDYFVFSWFASCCHRVTSKIDSSQQTELQEKMRKARAKQQMQASAVSRAKRRH